VGRLQEEGKTTLVTTALRTPAAVLHRTGSPTVAFAEAATATVQSYLDAGHHAWMALDYPDGDRRCGFVSHVTPLGVHFRSGTQFGVATSFVGVESVTISIEAR